MKQTTEFLDNKYTKTYFSIIENALLQRRVKLPKSDPMFTYYEEHHIIPRCVGGLELEHLVLLTAREHFLCHRLLTKMAFGNTKYRLIWALARFTDEKYSRAYERHKRYLASLLSSLNSGESNYAFGRIWISHPEKCETLYILKSEFQAYQQQGWIRGQKHAKFVHSDGTKNKVWINNGVSHKMVFPSQVEMWRSNGFTEGRLGNFRKAGLAASKVRHTPDKDRLHSEKMKGRKDILNLKTGECKRPPMDDLQSYLDSGWILGSPKNPNHSKQIKGRKNVIHPLTNERKVPPLDKLQKYLDEGWVLADNYTKFSN